MFPSKVHGAETIFTTMSRLAAQHHALNLGQGFPDYEMAPELIELLYDAMKSGHNQYTPLAGAACLREAIVEKIEFLYHLPVNADKEVCVTPGATYAIYTALTALLHKGDEVIVFEPAYDSYIPNIEINGARAVCIALSLPDFKIDWDKVAAAVTPRTKLIMINTPHNPTGMVLDSQDIARLNEIVTKNDLYVLSDEVYEHLVYDGYVFQSVLKYPELFKRSFVAYSFGKVYHCTGWKTGYCVAPEALMREFKKVHQYNCFCSFGPAQYALAAFLKNRKTYLNLGNFFQSRRDLLTKYLAASGLRPLPSHGSFFQLFDYSALSDMDELPFAMALTMKAGVSAIPVSAFYSDARNQHLLRFCFAKKESTIREAGARLQSYFAATR